MIFDVGKDRLSREETPLVLAAAPACGIDPVPDAIEHTSRLLEGCPIREHEFDEGYGVCLHCHATREEDAAQSPLGCDNGQPVVHREHYFQEVIEYAICWFCGAKAEELGDGIGCESDDVIGIRQATAASR